jgi:hypothetical protein
LEFAATEEVGDVLHHDQRVMLRSLVVEEEHLIVVGLWLRVFILRHQDYQVRAY